MAVACTGSHQPSSLLPYSPKGKRTAAIDQRYELLRGLAPFISLMVETGRKQPGFPGQHDGLGIGLRFVHGSLKTLKQRGVHCVCLAVIHGDDRNVAVHIQCDAHECAPRIAANV